MRRLSSSRDSEFLEPSVLTLKEEVKELSEKVVKSFWFSGIVKTPFESREWCAISR